MSAGFRYTACGLNYVYLRNGFALRQRKHGREVVIHDAEALHGMIARAIVTRSYPLRGREVRFLRSLLKLSQLGLARILQTSRVTVARWEAATDQPIKGTADTALRLLYAIGTEKMGLAEQVYRVLREMDIAVAEHPITLRETSRGWQHEREGQAG